MSEIRLSTRIDVVLRGPVVPFGPHGEPSAIGKQPVAGPLWLGRLGLEHDAQADLRVHGGPDKALHHFPFEHYAQLAPVVPGLSAIPGGFGENLSSSGLSEADVCLGDIYRFGDALLQLSQGRQPCWKLNVRFARRDMARLVQQQGCTGWYYRVLQEGMVEAGDRLTLIERPCAAASLARILHVLYRDPLNIGEMQTLVDLPVMPQRWRELLQARLARGTVEDMRRRVDTPVRE